jgi:rRNA maturation RNase YbeY
VSVQHELRRVMVHGLLHLLGHSDKNAAKRKAMSALEDKCLAQY